MRRREIQRQEHHAQPRPILENARIPENPKDKRPEHELFQNRSRYKLLEENPVKIALHESERLEDQGGPEEVREVLESKLVPPDLDVVLVVLAELGQPLPDLAKEEQAVKEDGVDDWFEAVCESQPLQDLVGPIVLALRNRIELNSFLFVIGEQLEGHRSAEHANGEHGESPLPDLDWVQAVVAVRMVLPLLPVLGREERAVNEPVLDVNRGHEEARGGECNQMSFQRTNFKFHCCIILY